jgi:hypothetical protein
MNEENKETGKFITIFFVLTGIVIVLCALLKPMAATDRIIALAVGSAGITGTTVRLFLSRNHRLCRTMASDEQTSAGQE